MYQYYISYRNRKGYGCSETWTKKKIKTFEQIKAIAESIEKDMDIKGVCINNFILLKRGRNK